jgi:hypothetical protein
MKKKKKAKSSGGMETADRLGGIKEGVATVPWALFHTTLRVLLLFALLFVCCCFALLCLL